MPHATSMHSTGFQALILCGPGVSLNTFTSNPGEFPKALIPIANRPMVWYPLDWCYRMGITNIQLITPPSSAKAIEASLAQNPYLTSLPSPRADVIAPTDLTETSGTAEIFRLPEVQAAITGDFLILPCDLVCEIPGESLLEAWMIQQAGFGGSSSVGLDYGGPKMGIGGERGGRRGGLGVWFDTKGEGSVKGEETDFVITAPLNGPIVPPPEGSLRSHISQLVYSTTADTLSDITSEKKSFPIRHGLIRKHGKIRILNTFRDAHIYLFPHWVLEIAKLNESTDSIGEDVVGLWAKAGWQNGLGDKLGLREILGHPDDSQDGTETYSHHSGILEEDMDIYNMSTTQTGSSNNASLTKVSSFASRVSTPHKSQQKLNIPPILAYIHPSSSTATSSSMSTPRPSPLIRRVDTSHLLLSVSLYLATLPSFSDSSISILNPSPFSHPDKISPQSTIAPRTTIHTPTTLIGPNSTISEKCVIKECVIGANCSVQVGARLTKCLLMDGVEIGEKVQLTGCILGRRSRIGKECVLWECEVQNGNMVPEGTDSRGEKFMIFEGLDGDDDEEVDEVEAGLMTDDGRSNTVDEIGMDLER